MTSKKTFLRKLKLKTLSINAILFMLLHLSKTNWNFCVVFVFVSQTNGKMSDRVPAKGNILGSKYCVIFFRVMKNMAILFISICFLRKHHFHYEHFPFFIHDDLCVCVCASMVWWLRTKSKFCLIVCIDINHHSSPKFCPVEFHP